jgi:N-acyl-D-amino-acid deacylase
VPHPPFDVLIAGGHVVDGTGNPWFRADVGVVGDRVVAVGPLAGAPAKHRLDAAGKVVAPGFIDAHVHGDLAPLMDPAQEAAIRQGVTTYIIGQDGVAMAPASPATLEHMCRYTAGFSGGLEWLEADGRPHWRGMGEYLACFDNKSAINVACLVPNGNVRLDVMGLEIRPPSVAEVDRMAGLVREAMEEGAVGLSTGLDYIPSRYATTEELIGLCKAIAPFGGIYVTHMRRYDPEGLNGSVDEVYRIGREAGCGVHISHFNSRPELALPKLDEGRAAGMDVTFDLYCYTYGSSIVGMVALPPWVQEGGTGPTLERITDPAVRNRLRDWFAKPWIPHDCIRLSYISSPKYRHLEGRWLIDAAREAGAADVGTFVCDLLIACRMAACCVVRHGGRTEADVQTMMAHPAMMGGSDGIYTGRRPHPRGWGCFARYLGHHVRDAKTWSLETAVLRLAAHPARRFNLRDRGLIREGLAADVIVFDPATIADRSTFDDGRQLAVGMEHVLVNGTVVLHTGQRTTALPGRGLRA